MSQEENTSANRAENKIEIDLFETSLFKRLPINEADDYTPFYHCYNYIQNKAKTVNLKDKEWQANLMDKCYRNHPETFPINFDSILQLSGRIPKCFLYEIGVDLDTLRYCYELDLENYERAKGLTHYPTYFVIRWMPAVYQTGKIPKGYTEINNFLVDFSQEYKNKVNKQDIA